jgi:hypothetical protein
MSYADFQRYVANYGFPTCPLTEEQFNAARSIGATDGEMYGIACDVNAGVDFHVAGLLNTQRNGKAPEGWRVADTSTPQ